MEKLKSLIAIALACCMVLTGFSAMAATPAKLLCDVNSDGTINAKDILLLKQYLALWQVTIDMDCSDINRDDAVNAKDLLMLRQVLATVIETPTFADGEQPGTEVDLPDGYPSEMLGCSVNQVGYITGTEKIAKVLFGDSTARTAVCYVVNAESGKAVFSAETDRKHYDATGSCYVADFDFSSVNTQGRYYIATPRGVSPTFEISDNPYREVQDAMITALYYNRCGTALDASIVGEHYAHGVCHAGNTRVTVLNLFDTALGKYKDNGVRYTSDQFSGGLHDAGDYGRYVVPGNQVIAAGVYSAELFPNGVNTNVITDKAGENISDMLDEARYEMEWVLKMQNPETGGVYYRLVTKEFASWTDKPDQDNIFDSLGLYASYEHLKSTAGMVGCAAACYTAFKDIDLDFATRCLAAAKKGYTYVTANMNDKTAHYTYAQQNEYNGASAGAYGADSAWNEVWFATAALARATGEAGYAADAADLLARRKAGNIGIMLNTISGYNLGGAGSIAFLQSDTASATDKATVLAALKSSADGFKKTTEREYFSVSISAGGFYWGSSAIVGNHITDCAVVAYFLETDDYDQTIRDNINFLFGSNHSGYSFVTGFGDKSPLRPHHRPSIARYYENGNTPDPVPGWVVGGIAGNYYVDKDDNYQTNEVCIYWNTPVVFALAYVLENDNV